MIQWVYEGAVRAKTLQGVLVATDDERIRVGVAAFGGEAIMTSPDHPSGTDRIAEAVAGTEAEIVVNVQGDEPLIDPDDIDAVVEELKRHPGADLATLAVPLTDEVAFHDPSVVKVVSDESGRALYFSRAAIPWPRGGGKRPEPESARQHVGIYAYRREFLERFCSWEPTPLERLESLEQLRALEHGADIRVAMGTRRGPGVDHPEDLAIVDELLRERLALSGRSAEFD